MDKNIINSEMLVHIPMCSHKEPQTVLAILADEAIKNELVKYDSKVTFSDSFNIDGKFDVVIYNSDILDDIVMANVARNLEDKCGIFACKVVSFDENSQTMKKELSTVARNFWIAMPYNAGENMMILASKKYHPQADIILDRSDFIESNYYNTELHNASFVMPNYIQKPLTGIAKR
ncbi:MAG: spermidine synthase [Arcobacter sp.]|nr:spermidine synthase [Arcobacter sp.]